MQELYLIQIPNKKFKVSVVYLPSNATIQSAIQVRKQWNDTIEIIQTFERYNYLQESKLINDSVLQLIVKDTISILGSKSDTVLVEVK